MLHAPITAAMSPSHYSSEALAEFGNHELVEVLIRDEDRAPRNLIDECARRGDTAVADLQARFSLPEAWAHDVPLGAWWLRLHAVMIIGLIPTENAERALVHWMRRMSEAGDDDLEEWLSGFWPALFRNKPNTMVEELRALCADRNLDWYMRANAMDAFVAAAERLGPEALDTELAWLARLAADEREDWDARLSAGSLLLDFPRAAHHDVVESLAKQQDGFGRVFTPDEVYAAYKGNRDDPEWLRFDNPWRFYEPEAMAERQRRWAEEEARAFDRDLDEALLDPEPEVPYMRAAPKIGRNAPCPCGSGKKYKKCCL